MTQEFELSGYKAERVRLIGLVRHPRGELHQAGLISDEEYAGLESVGTESARRLESYDELSAEVGALRLQLAKRTSDLDLAGAAAGLKDAQAALQADSSRTIATEQELSALTARFYAAADALGKTLSPFTPHQRLLILSNCIAQEVNHTLSAK